MKTDVITDPEKVKFLVHEDICPYCGQKTATKLGDSGGRFGPYIEKTCALIFYHCTNHDCSHANYYVRKADYKRYEHQ